jgi:LDH2 family malate/lactate/ureidoglycolate dehydrogenase
MPTVFLPVDLLRSFMNEAMVRAGVPADDAVIVTDVLISSDLRGIESHGIGRLKLYLDRIRDGVQKAVTKLEIVKESPGTALLDGNHGMGHLIAYRAMEMAIQKAGRTGIGAVSVRNGTHFGIAGYYSLMAVKAGMIGIAVTNARPSVAPTFGSRPMLGTNPIAFGAPTDEDCPFLLDMGTPITQRGKIEVLEREGKPVPEGWAIDALGNPITDPSEVLNNLGKGAASLLPLGGAGEELAGYKGYGLATMVEILSASLGGGPFCWGLSGIDEKGAKVPNRMGHFFIAIDISRFVDLDAFKKSTGGLMRSLRNSSRLPGKEKIYTAGEKEFEKERLLPNTGIPVNESLQATMKQVKAEYGIKADLNF